MKDFLNGKGQLGEDFVNTLAFSSFLKYWCYPGPLDITADNREICDLLIVFDNACIIVSVKNYSFNGNYERYFRKTIDKAIKQINGAERRLFGDRPILLKHPDRNPELFDKEEIREVYRVVVNLNTDVKFYQSSFFQDGKSYGVMDAEAWMDALEVLDTIPDFLAYIKSRSDFFGMRPSFIFPREEFDFSVQDRQAADRLIKPMAKDKGNIIIINGKEVDLIAYFFLSGFSFGDVAKPMAQESLIFSIDGQWEKLRADPVYHQKLEMERDSYFFDNLVAKYILNTDEGHHLARMLFRFKRLDRAHLSKVFQDYHDKISGRSQVLINRTTLIFRGSHFLFLWYLGDAKLEQLNAFMELALLHFHYRLKFENVEIGAIGLSNSKDHVAYGYSKRLEEPSAEDIANMEARFVKEGWSLND